MAAPLRSLEVTRVEDACSSDAADGRRLRVRQEDVLASLQLKGVAVEPHLEHALPLERAAQPRVVEAVHVVLDVVQQGRVGQRLGRLAAEDRAAGEQLEHERLRLLLDLSIDEHFDAHLLLVAQQRDGAARPRRAVSLLRDEEEVRVKVLVDGKVQQKTEPLVLELLAGCPILGSKAAEALPDPSLLDDVENYVHCLDYARLRGALEREGVLKVGLNGHAFELKRGEHIFLSYSEAAAVGGV
mmetsp:Transcript_2177/g.6813  ORF Transcript_2177/g.6813 Transcript_2177/m.6813 type:complete len:242 (-) Transcript_2177:175-900(-)